MTERRPSETLALLHKWRRRCVIVFALSMFMIIGFGDRALSADWIPDEAIERTVADILPAPAPRSSGEEVVIDWSEVRSGKSIPLADTPVWYQRYIPPEPEVENETKLLQNHNFNFDLLARFEIEPEPATPTLADHIDAFMGKIMGLIASALMSIDWSFFALMSLGGVFGFKRVMDRMNGLSRKANNPFRVDILERWLVYTIAVSYLLASASQVESSSPSLRIFAVVAIILLPELITRLAKKGEKVFAALQDRLVYTRSTVELPIVFLTVAGLVHSDWQIKTLTAAFSDFLIASAIILALLHLGLLTLNRFGSNGSRPGPI